MTTDNGSGENPGNLPGGDGGNGNDGGDGGQKQFDFNSVDMATILPAFDEDARAMLANKGWDKDFGGIVNMASSYRELERSVGGRVRIPDEGDEKGWNDLFGKLGRPEAAEGYEFKPDEGVSVDPGMENWFKAQAHEAGLSQAQASKLYGEWNKFVGAHEARAEEERTQQFSAANDALKREWGEAYQANITKAAQASAALGFDAKVVDAIEDAIGFAATMKLFSGLGDKFSAEDGFVQPNGGGANPNGGMGASMTPAQARDEKLSLLADPAFSARYNNGDPAAVGHISRLNKAIAAGR